MKYRIERDSSYDFLNQSYASSYPNLHRYPATMLPQIGIKLLKDFKAPKTNLLDPYCGSGSSFASALEHGIDRMDGFDINPLAILISKAKFTKIGIRSLENQKSKLRNAVFEFIKDEENLDKLEIPEITNIDFWFSKEVSKNLNILRYFIFEIKNSSVRNFLLIPFSETIRECSYTRNKEFKLYRMKYEDTLNFTPDVFVVFLKKVNNSISIYSEFYFPKLSEKNRVKVNYAEFKKSNQKYDTILTSPPYGDSRTTVAYGQFSTLSNEWMGIKNARKIDNSLMGGKKSKKIYQKGVIADYINQISKEDEKRALDVSSFCEDLEGSINKVSQNVKKGGKVFYIVGNRRVKNIELPTDQFIAEKFEENRFEHITTIQRALSNKTMPSKNSPTNKRGKTANTILSEYIVVCERR